MIVSDIQYNFNLSIIIIIDLNNILYVIIIQSLILL